MFPAVRCFGTEDRAEGDDAIEGTTDVYDYIVFAGKDIKDLNVITAQPEEPKPPAPLQDPAIMVTHPIAIVVACSFEVVCLI